MQSKKVKIMLVEDNVNLGFLLVDFLESNGFEVKLYKDGNSALRGIENIKFDFFIFDIMLPGISGFDLAKHVRQIDEHVPVIFITAKSMKEDILKGYDVGADDYIIKPFDEDQLLCKINAIMKRVSNVKPEADIKIEVGKYLFDYKNQFLRFNDIEKRLTKTENEVLNILCSRKNQIVKRDEILMKVWGNNDYFNGRSLDVFITKLRKYLSSDLNLQIENIPTVGFMLSEKNS